MGHSEYWQERLAQAARKPAKMRRWRERRRDKEGSKYQRFLSRRKGTQT